MNTNLSGGCAYGSVRYQCETGAEFSIICQCRQCQRISGSGHAAQFAVAAKATTVTGQLNYHELTADSGNTVSSGFCPTCGNPVLKKTGKRPDLLFFHAATLDEPSTFRPQVVVFASAKQPWDCVDPSLPRR